MITDPALFYVGDVADLPPILDGSIQPTVERFMVEQLALAMAETPAYSRSSTYMLARVRNWFTTQYVSTAVPILSFYVNMRRTGQIGNNLYSDITTLV